jgi:hypothetical protein
MSSAEVSMRLSLSNASAQVLLAVGLLPGSAVDAQETAMRCGNDLVDIGDSVYEVLTKCGEPTFIVANMWIYDPGPTQFTRQVTFDLEGTVLSVEVAAER